ncbi:hypothetical protein BKA62DRAFT_278980 [Auriculariales sp. MPI-PUGE-AT-0066]|nr:hypothetical protein BKA62DRAFT_278980 [Auriculariales sp. MPI-PUGE-AT-0066]
MSSSQPRALTAKQEHRLITYLDAQFLEISRGFKKRSQPDSPLATLDAYLAACHPLMSLILLIPPIDPSTALRAELLLRYTGEVLDAIPCYPATRAVLPRLSSWLDELDKGWSAVLDAKIWDTETSRGRDVSRALPNMVFSPTIEDVPPGTPIYSSTPVSITESTRLLSLLDSACDRIEEWLDTIAQSTNFRDIFFRRTYKIIGPMTPVSAWRPAASPHQSMLGVGVEA